MTLFRVRFARAKGPYRHNEKDVLSGPLLSDKAQDLREVVSGTVTMGWVL